MARHSAEERAASLHRAAQQPLPAPPGLSTRARLIWRQIVASKPADWFDTGCVGILADHCRLQIRIEAIWAELDRLPVGSNEGYKLAVQLKMAQSSYAGTTRQLRLGVQHVVELRAAKNGEKSRAAPNKLLGGLAVYETRRPAA